VYLADNLKYLRKINSLSQEDLADKLGVNRVNVGKWETGTVPRGEALDSLAKYFNVSPADLIYKPLTPVSDIDTNTKTTKVKLYTEEDNLNQVILPDNLADIDYDKLVEVLLSKDKKAELGDILLDAILRKIKP